MDNRSETLRASDNADATVRLSRIAYLIRRQAIKRLDRIAAAQSLTDLAALSGNRLEALAGNRKGQHSIRIDDQWRICFVWRSDGAHDVEIVDYHRG